MRSPGTRERLCQLIERNGWTRIGENEWSAIRTEFSLSEATLRKHLLALAILCDQPWRGVDASSLDSLEESLNELAAFYLHDPRLARHIVIRAKDQTRFIARNLKVAPENRALKSEMVEWMLVWLGDPTVFPVWARLRRSVLFPRSEKP